MSYAIIKLYTQLNSQGDEELVEDNTDNSKSNAASIEVANKETPDSVAKVTRKVTKVAKKSLTKVAKKGGAKRPKKPARPFPSCAFEEALEFAQAIHKFGSGKPIRRVTLFNELQKSPDSSTSRQSIIDAGKYGLVKGGYQADALQLTPEGELAVDEGVPAKEQTQARVNLAILAIPAFKVLYEGYAGNKLPARSVLADALEQHKVAREHISEGIDTFLVNVKFDLYPKPLCWY